VTLTTVRRVPNSAPTLSLAAIAGDRAVSVAAAAPSADPARTAQASTPTHA
jgi:hypothetical protein